MDWHSILQQSRVDFSLHPSGRRCSSSSRWRFCSRTFSSRAAQKGWNAITAMLGVVFSGMSLWLASFWKNLRCNVTQLLTTPSVIDPFFIFFRFLFLASTALVILLGPFATWRLEREQHGEYYALMLLRHGRHDASACGNDLAVLFLALETMALSFYVFTGFLRRERRPNEAAMKYLLMGAFSSGILAYGFSILYGIAGSTHLDVISILSRRAPSDASRRRDPTFPRHCYGCGRRFLQNRRRPIPPMGPWTSTKARPLRSPPT